MVAIRKQIQRQYPELRIFIACSDNLFFWIENEPDVIRQSEIKDRLTEFAYIRQIETSSGSNHPLLEILTESNINIQPIPIRKLQRQFGNCLICPNGSYPTQPMPNVEKYKSYARQHGFNPVIVGSDTHQTYKAFDINPSGHDKLAVINNADWVIGVENEYLFTAGIQGVPVSLVPTGIGTNLFKALFRTGEILSL